MKFKKNLQVPFLLFALAAFSSTVFAQIEDDTELRFTGIAYTDALLTAAGAQVCASHNLPVKNMPFFNCVLTESDGRFSLIFRKRKGDRFNFFASLDLNGVSRQEAWATVPALRIVNHEPDEINLTETEVNLGFKTQVVNGRVNNSPETSTQITIEVCRLDAPLVCTVQKYTWTPGMTRRPYEISTPAKPFTFRFRYERDEWGEWIAVAKNNRTSKSLRIETDADGGTSIKITILGIKRG